MLSSGGAAITNGQTFFVGDGTNAATYNLRGGVHNFADNLTIRTNAFLTGCGTVNGNVTVDPGGTVAADCDGGGADFFLVLSPSGTLTFTGIVTNNGHIQALNGTVVEAHGPVVNNGVINVLDGGTNFHSTFINNGLVITSNSIPIITSIRKVGSNVQIRFTADNALPYVVQYATDLASGDWTPLTNMTGNGSILTAIDPGAATLSNRFYRAGLVVP